MAGLIVKLQGCELNHQLAALAIDALGELGVLYRRRAAPARQGPLAVGSYMFDLGLIIGGGTAQIQKNIIAERGLGMPREPKVGGGVDHAVRALRRPDAAAGQRRAARWQNSAPLERVRTVRRRAARAARRRSGRGLAELGLPGLLIPEEHGGLGLGLLEAALAAEALGRRSRRRRSWARRCWRRWR